MVARSKKDTAGDGLEKKTAESFPDKGGQDAEIPEKTGGTEDLMARLQEAEKRAAENYDKYLRAVAELDNYRKRVVREKADAIRYGNETLIRDMLPLVDGMAAKRAFVRSAGKENGVIRLVNFVSGYS